LRHRLRAGLFGQLAGEHRSFAEKRDGDRSAAVEGFGRAKDPHETQANQDAIHEVAQNVFGHGVRLSPIQRALRGDILTEASEWRRGMVPAPAVIKSLKFLMPPPSLA